MGNFFRKKMPKKLKRGPFSLSRYGILGGKTFLVQFAMPNDSIWDHKTLGPSRFNLGPCRTFKNYFGQFVWIEKKSL